MAKEKDMRKVEVFKYVRDHVAEKDSNNVVSIVDKQVPAVEYTGTILAFGTDYEELNNGIGNYPVALIEKDDGTIASVSVNLIRFIL
jgi:hypothetical protein